MSRRSDNATWEEYINKFEGSKSEITLKKFCIENNLSKGQFHYHKRPLANGNSKETTFSDSEVLESLMPWSDAIPENMKIKDRK